MLQIITDTVSISNNSTNSAPGFSLVDTLPEHTTFLSWVQQSVASIDENRISFNGNVAGTESLTIQYTLLIDSDPALAGQIVIENLQYSFISSQPVSIYSNIQIPYRIYLPTVNNQNCPPDLPTCNSVPNPAP